MIQVGFSNYFRFCNNFYLMYFKLKAQVLSFDKKAIGPRCIFVVFAMKGNIALFGALKRMIFRAKA